MFGERQEVGRLKDLGVGLMGLIWLVVLQATYSRS